jgi:hypothetical protein
MGPGTFTVGAIGDPVDFSAQLASCTVKWAVAEEDPVPVLSGDQLEGDETWTATVSGNFIQDWEDDGIGTWSWEQKGVPTPFTYYPSSGAKGVAGVLKPRPLDMGGEAKKTMRSDFEWPCVGEPTLVDDLP